VTNEDWVNDTTGDFTWRRIKGSTDSIGTGNFEDIKIENFKEFCLV